MNNNITGFTFFNSYYESLNDEDIPIEDKKDLIYAIVQYVFEDIEPNFKGIKKTVWILIKPTLLKSKNKSKNAKKEFNENQNEIKMKSKRNQNEISHLMNKEYIYNNNIKYNNISNFKLYNNNNNIYNYIEKNFCRTLSSIEYLEISKWENNSLTRHAIDKAVLNGKYNINYISRILDDYNKNSIKTISQAIEKEENFLKNKKELVKKNSLEKFREDIDKL